LRLSQQHLRLTPDPDAPGLAGLEQIDQWKLYWQTRLKPTG
jgi:hypothetical protein